MKKLLLLSGCLLMGSIGFSQTNTTAGSKPDYLQMGIIPAFTTYKAPDSTIFTNKNIHKGKPLLMMLFSPDCGHCQHVVTEILQNMSHFKKTQILMFTWLPYSDMVTFYKTYKIADYPQITMAWDPKFFFVPYYHVQSYPKLIVYDKKGKLIKELQGDIKIEEVWNAFDKK